MNERKHWNKIANQYNEEIFDVFASDKKKLLPKYFNKHSNKKGLAIDFGCGNGKAFRYLSPRFKRVIGSDISENLLKVAAQRGYSNTELIHRDLALPETDLPKADFIFSCNVIMLPSLEDNYRMFKNIANCLKKGKSAVVVIPATESIMYSSWQLTEVYRKEGVAIGKIDSSEFDFFQGKPSEIAQGIFYIDGVPTKHYSAYELEVVVREAGLKLTAIERLEYGWDSELSDPPSWLKEPYPWDWVIEMKKS